MIAAYAHQTVALAAAGPLATDDTDELCSHVECQHAESCIGQADATPDPDVRSHTCDRWCDLGLPLCPF